MDQVLFLCDRLTATLGNPLVWIREKRRIMEWTGSLLDRSGTAA